VIGTGYVGLVSGTCYAEIGNNVICCDIDRQKIERLARNIVTIYEPGLEELIRKNANAGKLSFTDDIGKAIRSADIVYIAVGTPMLENGEADLSYVREAARMIGQHMNDYKVVVTKSTVPIGTNRLIDRLIREHLLEPGTEFDVVSNPEFLREGSAIRDCMNMERAIIGAASERAANSIVQLHQPFDTQIVVTDWESAEMIKYASNTFLATKISFVNSLANLCERFGADIEEVAIGMGLDSRIGGKFLQAGIGYGGSCFPKDTYALKHMADNVEYEFKILDATIETNHSQRFLVLDKLESALGGLDKQRIAVLGASFKPNTNDLREAPSLTLIPEMLDKGAFVHVYDPAALDELADRFGADVRYHHDVYEAVAGSDALLILTEWKQILDMDLDRVKALMARPIIVDGRNCFHPSAMRAKEFSYYSVGRAPVISPISLPVQV
jgi:UDPglucose 6-dehydrogenase